MSLEGRDGAGDVTLQSAEEGGVRDLIVRALGGRSGVGTSSYAPSERRDGTGDVTRQSGGEGGVLGYFPPPLRAHWDV